MPNSGVRRYAAALQSLVSAGARDGLARAEEPVVNRASRAEMYARVLGPRRVHGAKTELLSRGTEGSNPSPSSGESANHQFLSVGAIVRREPAVAQPGQHCQTDGSAKSRCVGRPKEPHRGARTQTQCCCNIHRSRGRPDQQRAGYAALPFRPAEQQDQSTAAPDAVTPSEFSLAQPADVASTIGEECFSGSSVSKSWTRPTIGTEQSTFGG
jgi:hypothetical protein